MPTVIYWIYLDTHTDPFKEGYIGVSKRYESRITDHYRKMALKLHKNPHLIHAAEKYGLDSIRKKILVIGPESYCYEVEEKLRPTKNIGWNISQGGHRGPGWPRGRKRSAEQLEAFRQTVALRKIKTEENRIALKVEKEKNKQDKKNAKILKKQKDLSERKLARERIQLAKDREKEESRRQKEIKKENDAKKKLIPKRPLCNVCTRLPVAVNYRTSDGVVHYRTRCDSCIRKKKKLPAAIPSWHKVGYKKKPHCEKCGFKAKYKEQLFVYYIDGNLNNNNLINLKTICANCQVEVAKEGLGWRQGDLVPDF